MAGRSRFLRHYAPGLALAVWVPTVALGAWAWWSATQRGREPDDTRRAVRVHVRAAPRVRARRGGRHHALALQQRGETLHQRVAG